MAESGLAYQKAQTRGVKAPAKPRLGFRKRIASVIGPSALALTLVFLLGFIIFAERISAMQQPELIAAADGIVVLTGGQYRLETAVALLADGKGKRLLISGVNPSIDKNDVAKLVGGDPEKFKCCVDIDYRALETVGNATETAKWVRNNDFHSIILVTNNYHMPRSLLELKRVTGKVEILPYPVVNSDLGNGAWTLRPETIRVLFAEYLKYLGALSRAVLPVPVSIGSMMGPAKAAAPKPKQG